MATSKISVFGEVTENALFNVPAFVDSNCESAWQDRLQKAYYIGKLSDTVKALEAFTDIEEEALEEEALEEKHTLEALKKNLETLVSPAVFVPHICFYMLAKYIRTIPALPEEGTEDDNELAKNERGTWNALYNACKTYYDNGFSEGKKSEAAEKRIRDLYLKAINSMLVQDYTTGSFKKSEEGTPEFINIPIMKQRRKVTNTALQSCVIGIFPKVSGKKSKEDKKSGKLTTAGFSKRFPKPEAFKRLVINEFLLSVGVTAEDKKKA